MSITVTVTNDTIKLPEGVHFPDGTTLELHTIKPPRTTIAERLAKHIGVVKDGPIDSADSHDHYASGAPKQKP